MDDEVDLGTQVRASRSDSVPDSVDNRPDNIVHARSHEADDELRRITIGSNERIGNRLEDELDLRTQVHSRVREGIRCRLIDPERIVCDRFQSELGLGSEIAADGDEWSNEALSELLECSLDAIAKGGDGAIKVGDRLVDPLDHRAEGTADVQPAVADAIDQGAQVLLEEPEHERHEVQRLSDQVADILQREQLPRVEHPAEQHRWQPDGEHQRHENEVEPAKRTASLLDHALGGRIAAVGARDRVGVARAAVDADPAGDAALVEHMLARQHGGGRGR